MFQALERHVHQIRTEKYVVRFKNKRINVNAVFIIEAITGNYFRKATFFATSRDENRATQAEGSATNFPLVSAIIQHHIPGFGLLHVVYDGYFLTAQSAVKAAEVEEVLDYATVSNDTSFSIAAVPFTSSLPPGVAADLLMKWPVFPLTAANRKLFRSML